MSHPVSFEQSATPSDPTDRWLADYASLLESEVAEYTTKLAETLDDNERDRQREFLKLLEIAQARLEHIDELVLLCCPIFSIDQISDKLGNHIETLDKQLTSQTVRQASGAHSMPAFEEEKLRAKITDTVSLRGVVERQ